MSEPAIGDQLRVLTSIFDDGDDNHHPPGHLACPGDAVFVKNISEDGSPEVAHKGRAGSFVLLPGEWEHM